MKICPMCGASYDDANLFCTVDGAALRSLADGNDLIHTVIADRYLITEQLGEGGMGRVYLAKHVRLPQKWAIKVLHPALVRDAGALARFNQEAASASRIENRHVARVIDFGETGDGVLYLAMEYVDGESLARLMEREGALEPRRAAEIARQVAEALTAAHELGIVHRDLKPDNIMLGRARDGGDDVRVVDFGIAKVIHQDDSEKLTRTGFAIGTPEYMSPEQIKAGSMDGRSDVYSLGLVTFRMLTGALPFPADTAQERMLMRVTHPPRTLAEMRGDVSWPAPVQSVLDRALARDADARYQNAGDFADDLVRAVNAWLSPLGAASDAVAAAELSPVAIATPPEMLAASPTRSPSPASTPVPSSPNPARPGPSREAAAEEDARAKVARAKRSSSPKLRGVALATAALLLIGAGGVYFAHSDRGAGGAGATSTADTISRGPAASPGPTPSGTSAGTETIETVPGDPAVTDSSSVEPPPSRAARPDPALRAGSPGKTTGASHDAGAGASVPVARSSVVPDPRSPSGAEPAVPGGGAPSGVVQGRGSEAGTALTASRARARLDDLQTMVEDLTENGARRAIATIPGVLPQLPTRSDTVEAWYYGLQASLILGDLEEACKIVGVIGTDARSTRFAAPIRVFSDSLKCR